MWQTAQSTRVPGRGARCLAALLASLVLFLASMAASPVAHGVFHHDSADTNHQCAITMFAHGVENVGGADSSSWMPAPAHQEAPAIAESIATAEPAHLRPPSSGPPLV